jgi:hypothetical protein
MAQSDTTDRSRGKTIVDDDDDDDGKQGRLVR